MDADVRFWHRALRVGDPLRGGQDGDGGLAVASGVGPGSGERREHGAWEVETRPTVGWKFSPIHTELMHNTSTYDHSSWKTEGPVHSFFLGVFPFPWTRKRRGGRDTVLPLPPNVRPDLLPFQENESK